MRGDRTIELGQDAKLVRERKLKEHIQMIQKESIIRSIPAGYCGKCKKHYLGNYTNHTCNFC